MRVKYGISTEAQTGEMMAPRPWRCTNCNEEVESEICPTCGNKRPEIIEEDAE